MPEAVRDNTAVTPYSYASPGKNGYYVLIANRKGYTSNELREFGNNNTFDFPQDMQEFNSKFNPEFDRFDPQLDANGNPVFDNENMIQRVEHTPAFFIMRVSSQDQLDQYLAEGITIPDMIFSTGDDVRKSLDTYKRSPLEWVGEFIIPGLTTAIKDDERTAGQRIGGALSDVPNFAANFGTAGTGAFLKFAKLIGRNGFTDAGRAIGKFTEGAARNIAGYLGSQAIEEMAGINDQGDIGWIPLTVTGALGGAFNILLPNKVWGSNAEDLYHAMVAKNGKDALEQLGIKSGDDVINKVIKPYKNQISDALTAGAGHNQVVGDVVDRVRGEFRPYESFTLPEIPNLKETVEKFNANATPTTQWTNMPPKLRAEMEAGLRQQTEDQLRSAISPEFLDAGNEFNNLSPINKTDLGRFAKDLQNEYLDHLLPKLNKTFSGEDYSGFLDAAYHRQNPKARPEAVHDELFSILGNKPDDRELRWIDAVDPTNMRIRQEHGRQLGPWRMLEDESYAVPFKKTAQDAQSLGAFRPMAKSLGVGVGAAGVGEGYHQWAGAPINGIWGSYLPQFNEMRAQEMADDLAAEEIIADPAAIAELLNQNYTDNQIFQMYYRGAKNGKNSNP